eukprot:2936914-Amphidinium_carterae.1
MLISYYFTSGLLLRGAGSLNNTHHLRLWQKVRLPQAQNGLISALAQRVQVTKTAASTLTRYLYSLWQYLANKYMSDVNIGYDV